MSCYHLYNLKKRAKHPRRGGVGQGASFELNKLPILSKKARSFQQVERRDCTWKLCSNRWTLRGTLLQSILDNWAFFQELWDDILEGKVDSQIRGQVIRVQTQKQSFNFFFWIQLGVVLMHRQLCNTHTSCYKGQ